MGKTTRSALLRTIRDCRRDADLKLDRLLLSRQSFVPNAAVADTDMLPVIAFD